MAERILLGQPLWHVDDCAMKQPGQAQEDLIDQLIAGAAE